jgi:hypothetical protein
MFMNFYFVRNICWKILGDGRVRHKSQLLNPRPRPWAGVDLRKRLAKIFGGIMQQKPNLSLVLEPCVRLESVGCSIRVRTCRVDHPSLSVHHSRSKNQANLILEGGAEWWVKCRNERPHLNIWGCFVSVSFLSDERWVMSDPLGMSVPLVYCSEQV